MNTLSRSRLLTLPVLIVGSLALLGLGGCGEDAGPTPGTPPVDGKADRTSGDPSIPTLTFGADGVISQAGQVEAGKQLRVIYALERLDECRASSGGYPQWSVTGFYSVDGGSARSFEVSRTSGSDRLPVAALLDVPAGRDLAFWFEASNRYGCHQYDSDDGANFHVAIGAAGGAEALLVFGADGSVDLQGKLVAGGTLRVRYALDRLSDCRGTQGGLPQWNVTGAYSVDGGEPSAFEVSAVSGDDRVSTDALLEVPRGDAMALWFYVSNRWGCIAYDSKFGDNYVFPISE